MASFYIGLYIVRRYYAEKQQKTKKTKTFLNSFLCSDSRVKLPFEGLDYNVVWHKQGGVTNWKMRCLHSSGYRLT